MSGAGFHVHGPHDHQIEHATQANGNQQSLAEVSRILTAVVGMLAVLHD